jgi:hypothetical protein
MRTATSSSIAAIICMLGACLAPAADPPDDMAVRELHRIAAKYESISVLISVPDDPAATALNDLRIMFMNNAGVPVDAIVTHFWFQPIQIVVFDEMNIPVALTPQGADYNRGDPRAARSGTIAGFGFAREGRDVSSMFQVKSGQTYTVQVVYVFNPQCAPIRSNKILVRMK